MFLPELAPVIRTTFDSMIVDRSNLTFDLELKYGSGSTRCCYLYVLLNSYIIDTASRVA